MSLDLHLDVSSANARLALSSLSLTRLEIDTSSGDFQADLSGGQPTLAVVEHALQQVGFPQPAEDARLARPLPRPLCSC